MDGLFSFFFQLPIGRRIALIGIYFVLLNAMTYGLFWNDKRRAQTGRKRHAEKHLLLFAGIGGSVGALIASKQFRHKTHKQPFASIMMMILVVHVGLVLGFLLNKILPH